MYSRLKHISLDFDGVIVEGTNDAYIKCYYESLVRAGAGLPFEFVRQRILANWGKSPELELAGVVPEDRDAVNRALEIYESSIESCLLSAVKPIEGSPQAIARLSHSYSLSIISGMGEAPLNRIVDVLKLRSLFCSIVSTSASSEPEKQKYTGYHLKELMKRMRFRPDEVLYAGDGRSDIEMAANAGVRMAAVTSGMLSAEEARAAGVELIIPKLSFLPDILGNEAP